jgi:hypothetical protein
MAITGAWSSSGSAVIARAWWPAPAPPRCLYIACQPVLRMMISATCQWTFEPSFFLSNALSLTLADGYGNQIDRSRACRDGSQSVVLSVTDKCAA